MGQGLLGDLDTAQHPRQFVHPFLHVQDLDAAVGAILLGGLAHLQVVVAEGRDLGQVGDADHLTLFAQGAQELADDFGHPAADPHVHLVEDQRGNAGVPGGDDLDGEADPGQFTAGGHLRQRFDGLAGIGADPELDAFQSRGRGGIRFQRLDSHLEAAAFHAQGLHAFGHSLAQFLRRAPTALAQFLRQFPVGGEGGIDLRLQVAGAHLGLLQLGQFGLQARQQGREFLRGAVMLAGQIGNRRQALLQLGQTFRVQFQAVQVVAQFRGGLAGLDHGAVEQIHHPGQLRIGFAHLAHVVQAAGEQAGGAGRIVAVQGQQHPLASLQQAAGVGQPPVFGLQLGQFALGQIQFFQLPDLVAQQFQPVVALAGGLAQPVQFRLLVAPVPEGFRQFAEQAAMAGEVVQQLALGLTAQQGLVLVLAVQIHQHLAQLSQAGGRCRLAVDEGLRGAIGGDHPADDALAGAVQFVFLQPGLGLGRIVGAEGDADFGLIGPVADHAGVGPIAQRQPQGIEQDRFAGAGLAGEHGQSTLQGQFQALDDGEVPDVKVGQHGISSARSSAAWPAGFRSDRAARDAAGGSASPCAGSGSGRRRPPPG